MNITVKLTAALLTIGLLAGCAGPNQRAYQDYTLCSALGGAVGGAAIGAAASGGSGAAGGAAVGAMLALLLCPTDEAQAAETAASENTMCEHEPVPGALLDAKGCAMDSDNDNVLDGIDMCANTPAGVTVDDVGCPIDSDRDGVADYKDLCPNTPEGVIVDEDGCPIAGQTILSLTGVNFEFDKSTLTSEAQDTLDEAVEALLNTDEVVEVRVEGHTDSIGSEEYNKQLSQERAQSVVDYLVSNGVNGNNLIPVGMGETSPVANNATDAGRALNRRVDFVVNSQ
ncbi:OmpA family protein [Methylophaga nitratireducenticrescens]|uniref:Outer membrane protein A n=1 Tax=Methylophaga nitratireducenticrescens TaxID=754476 RepID=I1XGL9_METNJ|nr:OmpA family protein [Methylophaga nitratireducenticrescens]AFI83538.1 OmpA family protein [Methylophaga nitratireducenticrescens]AUZ83637.1 OmpA family protein [Methylophaga nitratireducenticrescens]